MIDELPDAPDPANDTPSTFSSKAAAMVLAQKTMVTQFNAAIASLNVLFAGAAYALPYKFSAETADADPGPGYMRLNNAAQNAATAVRLDLLGDGNVDNTAAIASFSGSTSTVKGALRIAKVSDPRAYLRFNVTAVATPAGYRNVTVTFVDGSSANPFAADDLVLLMFTPKGDKGEAGNDGASYAAQILHVRDEKGNGLHGGASVGGIQTRALGTHRVNGIPLATTSGNQVTLPPGTYSVFARTPAFNVNRHRALFYNVTDATYALIGANAYCTSNVEEPSYGPSGTDSTLVGVLTLAGTKTFELRHYTSIAVANLGLGQACASGHTEIYSELFIEKVA